MQRWDELECHVTQKTPLFSAAFHNSLFGILRDCYASRTHECMLLRVAMWVGSGRGVGETTLASH